MGHRLDEAEELPLRRAHGAVRDDRARPVRRAAAASCRPSASSSSRRSTRETVTDGERVGVADYVRRRGRSAAGHGRRARGDGPVRAARLPRPHPGRAPARCRTPGRRPRRALAGRVRVALLHRRRSTSRDSPRSRCPAASRRAGCRSACRSPGPWAPTRSSSRSAQPSSGRWPDAMDAADLGVVEAAALIAERRLSASELTRACLARIRERDGTHSHEGDPASVNAWVRVYEEEALAAAAHVDDARALADGPLPQLCGIPIGLKDLYARRGRAADRVEQPARRAAARGLRRLEPAARPGHDPARPPPHARVRGRRDDRPGRQSVGARPLSGRIERRLGRGARRAHGARRHGHGHGRLAAHPVGAAAAPRRSSRRAGSSRCAVSCRSPRASTTRGRWRARSRIARRSWPRWRGRIPAARQRARSRAAHHAAGAAHGGRAARRRAPRALAPHRPRCARRRRRRRPRRRDRALPRARSRASSHRPRRASRSTSATTSSTSSTPSCSSTTAASTTGRERYRPSLREWVEQARGARRLGRALPRGADAPPRDDRRPRVVARRLPDLGADRADGAVRRTAARRRLRPRRQRLRADLAHALLGLDGLPGRRAAGGSRRAQRPAGRRFADRSARGASGICWTSASSCRRRSACPCRGAPQTPENSPDGGTSGVCGTGIPSTRLKGAGR